MVLFATRLRERAAELGISHAEAARRCGLSERRYGHYVSGLREPDLATLVKIAMTLQTTPNDLLGVGETSNPTPRALLIDRLKSATHALADDVLEIVVIQTESLTDWRKAAPLVQERS